MNKRSETQKLLIGNIELFRTDTCDVLVNKDFPDQSKIRRLFPVVQNGIPPLWVPMAGVGDSLIYLDSVKNPHFVGKIRKEASPGQYSTDMRDHQEDMDQENIVGTETDIRGKRNIRARNSLSNEIRLSPVIKTILKKDAIGKIAKKYGFKDIAFIEPLLGVIERTSGRKTMFYEYQEGFRVVEGASDLGEYDPHDIIGDLFDTTFVREFEAILREFGIRSQDIDLRQFIAYIDKAGNKHLYLLDIEDYFKV